MVPSRAAVYSTGMSSPAALFARGEQGVWYDPSDFTTMFQDSVASTPVTAVEQPVGMILDKSKNLALGNELVTNGSFASNLSGWTAGASITATWTSGEAEITTGGIGIDNNSVNWFYQVVLPTDDSKRFKVTFDATWVSGTANLQVGTGFSIRLTIAPNGGVKTSYSFIAPRGAASSDVNKNSIVFGGSSAGGVWRIDNVSVKEIAGNHASQATSTSRPVLSSRVNLLLNSLLNGGVSGTPGTAPTSWSYFTTGTPSVTFSTDSESPTGSAVQIVTDTTQRQQISQTINVAASTVYVLTAVVDVTSTTSVQQVVSFFSTPTGATVTWALDGATVAGGTSIGTGRHVVSAILTVSTTAGTAAARFGAQIQGAGTAVDITFRQVQVETGSLRTKYQWVNTATDYDTTDFPYYLKFDGTDDWLATTTISPGSVDKVQVFTGARRMTETLNECLVEYSATSLSNLGSFSIISDLTASIRFAFNLLGDGVITGRSDIGSAASPATDVISVCYDISRPGRESEISPRVNGRVPTLQIAGASSSGGGNFGSYPLYFGRRGGTTLPFSGNCYGLIVRFSPTNLDNGTILRLESWMHSKTIGR